MPISDQRFALNTGSVSSKARLCVLWLFSFGLLSACSIAVPPEEQVATAGLATDVKAEPLHNVSFKSVLALPANTKAMKLAYGSADLQFGLLYSPTVPTGKKPPLVIFVHGGCWLNAYDIEHSKALSQALAAEGYAVWSLEYRRVGDEGGGWPGSFNDIEQGITYAQSQFGQYDIDVSRLILMGHSAGGQLALLAAAKKAEQVRGVIGLAAITDMASYAQGGNSCQNATAQFMGASPQQASELYVQASPALQARHPRTLLLQGNADQIVPLTQATQSGMPYRMVDKAGHFDWIHPHSAAYPQLILSLQELLAQ